MTVDIAKLLEMRDLQHKMDNPFGYGAAAMDFQDALQEAVLPPPRGGLLERHAMLEKFWVAYETNGAAGKLRAAAEALRSSDVPAKREIVPFFEGPPCGKPDPTGTMACVLNPNHPPPCGCGHGRGESWYYEDSK